MYVANSAAFIANREVYSKDHDRICSNPLPIVSKLNKSMDIDDLNDFENLKYLLKNVKKISKKDLFSKF